MKVKIENDELYPYFIINNEYGTEIEISESKLLEWKRIGAEFMHMQEEIRKLTEAAYISKKVQTNNEDDDDDASSEADEEDN